MRTFHNAVRLDRRTLLRGAGASLALPLLEAMLPRGAFAAGSRGFGADGGSTGGAPKRLAFCFVPNGVHMPAWTPTGTGGDYALPATLAPLAGFRDQMLVLTGLTQHNAEALGDGGGDHARSAATWLTGCHPRKTSGADIKAGISADQVAARFLAAETRFPSLELGIERSGLSGDCDSGYSCAYSSAISWRTENTPVAKEVSPRAVFDRLFGDSIGEEDGAVTADEAAQIREAQGSILDAVIDQANTLNRKLGAHDREKLDEYLTSVREIEHRVRSADRVAALPAAAAVPPPAQDPDNMGDHIRLMGDMMVLAFQTDQTRVATLMFANEGSNRGYSLIGIPDGHHDLSHHGGNADKQAKLQKINQFHVEQLAYILQKMRDTPETGGSLLDHTVLIYGGGISDGNRHNHDDLPIMVAGGGRLFQAGRHVVYPDGTPLTNLFMTCFDRIGLPTDQIGSLGDSTGRLAQLF